jgi:hypothetical protein
MQGSEFQKTAKATMSIIDKARALNHWSVGVAFLGIIFSLAPAATEIGAGISAVGVVCYAAKKRRYPAWGLLSALPVLGALSALILLTVLPPRPSPEEHRPFPAGWLFSPLLWATVFFLFSVLAWVNFNPSAVNYKPRAYKQNRVDRSDSGRGLRIIFAKGYRTFLRGDHAGRNGGDSSGNNKPEVPDSGSIGKT